jgi:hypothetical protein
MGAVTWCIVVSALFPLIVAWHANRSTSLVYAIAWAVVAWAGWVLSLASGSSSETYLALGLTGCAGVAVLGARRPGAAAWNFVAGGLLAILLVPLAEARILDTPVRLGTTRTVFLASLLGVTVINYLPTRLGGGAILLGIGSGLELVRLVEEWPVAEPAVWCVALAPWAAWLGLRIGPKAALECDRAWRRFRDRYGLIWGLRLKEQFNHTSKNAGRNIELRWTGMRTKDGTPLDDETAAFAWETLTALTKRFGLP